MAGHSGGARSISSAGERAEMQSGRQEDGDG